MNNMKYTQARNCPLCDSERGITTEWCMSPGGVLWMQDRHAQGHPENSPKVPRELPRDSEITVTKLNAVYELTNGKETIEAEVHNGKLTLANHKGYEEFVFVGSDPKRVRRIANLMLEAVEIAEKV